MIPPCRRHEVGQHDSIEMTAMIGDEDERSVLRKVLAARNARPMPYPQERPQQTPDEEAHQAAGESVFTQQAAVAFNAAESKVARWVKIPMVHKVPGWVIIRSN